MGRAIKHFGWNRNDIVVSTKVRPGHIKHPSSLLPSHSLSLPPMPNTKSNNSPRSTGAHTTRPSQRPATKSTTSASPANTSSKPPPHPSPASNSPTSTSSTPTGQTATLRSRKPSVPSTTSSTRARHSTGAPRSGSPPRSKRPGPWPIGWGS